MNIIKNRISLLRQEMLDNNINAIIIPSKDPHASEYVAEHWKARAQFSGFTGSAGTLVITRTSAGLWTDSRYYIQAEEELRFSNIELIKEGEENTDNIQEWLSKKLKKGDAILMNSDLFSIAEIQEHYYSFSILGFELKTDNNIIDTCWKDRPCLPKERLLIHNIEFSGTYASDKLSSVRNRINEKSADYLILNSLDEIAWLFNIRGNDIAYNPVVISYAIIGLEEVFLFVDLNKINELTKNYFLENEIQLIDYSSIYSFVEKIKCKQIWLDDKKMNYAIYSKLKEKNDCQFANSPILELKSIKNDTEIDGFRKAMLKDGIALSKFLIWFENCMAEGAVLTELSVAEKIKSFRAEQEQFFGESFAPIVGYQEHGAIVHYSADNNSNAQIKPKGFLLIDSGAQFLHGTTDITRTYCCGEITQEQKRNYTLVLKGHIALAQAIFPKGTSGYQLDSLARQFLWSEGLNYGHGTGHGVGCFLCVHEGPQSIRPDNNKVALKKGMVISNEPGFYKSNEYGIRLENLILVVESDISNFFEFETLTLFPFDRNAINRSMLTNNEINWINKYHQKILNQLSPSLNPRETEWLKEKCKEII